MLRLAKMSGKWFGVQISSVEDDQENIQVFAEEGTPVIIADCLDVAMEVIGDYEEIEIVD